MAIEYLGLSSINGPLVVLEGVENAFYDEIVEFIVDHNTRKMGRIVELDEDKAVIQVFEGTENMSLDNTHTRLTGHPMEVTVSEEMLGRTFNRIQPQTVHPNRLQVKPALRSVPRAGHAAIRFPRISEASARGSVSSDRQSPRFRYGYSFVDTPV